MRGYSRVEDNLDEYENDEVDEYENLYGDEYRYAEDEEAEVEEEDPIPKKEVQEYLELRQKLKEAARKKLAKQSGLGSNARDTKRSKLENFGSFFGPSRPVIAERVIQESKSFLETRQEAPRLPSSQTDGRKAHVSATSAPKNGMSERRPHNNPVKTKVQKLKDTRDYSFLLSDDADIPKTAIVPPIHSNSAAIAVQGPSEKKNSGHSGRQIPNGSVQRRPVAVNSHTRPGQNLLHHKPSTIVISHSRRPESLIVPEHKKHNSVSSHGNGTSQPLLPKREPYPTKKVRGHLEREVAGASTGRKIVSVCSAARNPSETVTKVAMPNMQRSNLVKQQVVRQHSDERMVQSSKGKILLKQISSSLKPQMKVPKNISPLYNREDTSSRSRPLQQKAQPKSKPKSVRRPAEKDDNQAILEIRKMFGYNPNRYAGTDDDLSDMEADFRTIQMEEKRSARIAREEDERELMLIQEEEDRERKLAKKRKMGQR